MVVHGAIDQRHGGQRVRRALDALEIEGNAFLGGWLGGVVYDRTGSYDLVWQISILLSLLAAALNWPVRERPVARLQAQAA